MTGLSQAQVDAYHENGFLFPLRAFSPEETLQLRRRLEDAEAGASAGGERAARQGLPITHAWAWDLVHDPRIVEPISAVLGPDVLLWSMDWFIKNPGPSFVTYHQDATYWGLEPHHVATAWIALSDAGPATGPMRFVPGSHKGPVFEQDDTYAENNLLSRGQVVKAEVDESQTVLAALAPGEMSIHHVRVIRPGDSGQGQGQPPPLRDDSAAPRGPRSGRAAIGTQTWPDAPQSPDGRRDRDAVAPRFRCAKSPFDKPTLTGSGTFLLHYGRLTSCMYSTSTEPTSPKPRAGSRRPSARSV